MAKTITTLKVKDSVDNYVYPNIEGDSNIKDLSSLTFSILNDGVYSLSTYSIKVDENGLYIPYDDKNFYLGNSTSASYYFLNNWEFNHNRSKYVDLYDLIISTDNLKGDSGNLIFEYSEDITSTQDITITTENENLNNLVQYAFSNSPYTLIFSYSFKFTTTSNQTLSFNAMFYLKSRDSENTNFYESVVKLCDPSNSTNIDYFYLQLWTSQENPQNSKLLIHYETLSL